MLGSELVNRLFTRKSNTSLFLNSNKAHNGFAAGTYTRTSKHANPRREQAQRRTRGACRIQVRRSELWGLGGQVNGAPKRPRQAGRAQIQVWHQQRGQVVVQVADVLKHVRRVDVLRRVK